MTGWDLFAFMLVPGAVVVLCIVGLWSQRRSEHRLRDRLFEQANRLFGENEERRKEDRVR